MKKVFVVMSHDMQNVRHKEVEFVTFSEEDADDYVHEMSECCLQGRIYWCECWEVDELMYHFNG